MKKKWWILILILVVVAIVLTIVFINLFKERDTKVLSEKIYDVSQTGYLSPESKENAVIEEYLTNLLKLGGNFSESEDVDKKEVAKISNYLSAYNSFEISIQFFAREMIFAKASDTYISNRKKVEDNLSQAQKLAEELEKYISDPNHKTGGSNFWTAQTWADCREKMTKMINKTADAMMQLAEIYQKSVPSVVEGKGFLNNEFTEIILDEMTNLTKNITEKAEEDEKYGANLYNFVNAYLSEKNEKNILNYIYNNETFDETLKDKVTLQKKVEDIKEKGDKSEYFQSFIAGSLV